MMSNEILYNLILEYIDDQKNRRRKIIMQKASMSVIDKYIFNTKKNGIYFVYENKKSKPFKIRKKFLPQNKN